MKAWLGPAFVALVFLFAGYVAGVGTPAQDSVASCRTFCESLPGTPPFTFAFVRAIHGVDHCYCSQPQTQYDFSRDRTVTWTQTADFGSVSNLTVTNGIPADVRELVEQQG